jgi:hypothetical protein
MSMGETGFGAWVGVQGWGPESRDVRGEGERADKGELS